MGAYEFFSCPFFPLVICATFEIYTKMSPFYSCRVPERLLPKVTMSFQLTMEHMLVMLYISRVCSAV